jgi:4-alpha-glucanotransferase
MNSLNTIFAVHNHQPIGNFDSVLEDACQHSYKPFLEVLSRHPTVRFTQHWTGPLLEWLLRHHPELIERMTEMVGRGQLELLTGAYYEAVLAIIPEPDRIGQITKLTDFIEHLFGVRPRGMWLAERVWEQTLVCSLAAAGIEFVAVDDTHFRHAGLSDDDLRGYYVTEDQGTTLNVFPIDKTLRYTVPFRPVDETLHYFQRTASGDGRRVLLNADDGEKFGVWPKTFHSVYEEGWLENFCRMLDEQQAWIRTRHLGEVIDTIPPLGRIYLPAASYSEMMKWALNSSALVHLEQFEDLLKDMHALEANAMFVRGGYWRNFLAKYPEANHMHKKMLRVASRLRAAQERTDVPVEISDALWAGQCNDPYWHGVFGGLYLPNLRFPVYRSLLDAEQRLDLLEGPRGPRIEQTDFDCDGIPELLIESDEMNLFFTPASGGTLVELDYKPLATNLLDILSRREEGYHRRLLAHAGEFRARGTIHEGALAKEEGLQNHLHFDWYRHGSLIDHLFGPGTTLETFRQCRFLELGDFVNQPYTVEASVCQGTVEVHLQRDGAVWFGERAHRLSIRKTVRYRPGSGAYSVKYRLMNGEETPVEIWFGVEMNVGSMAGDAPDRLYRIDGVPPEDPRLRSTGEDHGVKSVALVDSWLGLETTFAFDRPATLWRCPIETVSLSEAGFERLYQGSMVVPQWAVTLDREFTIGITQAVHPL